MLSDQLELLQAMIRSKSSQAILEEQISKISGDKSGLHQRLQSYHQVSILSRLSYVKLVNLT